MAETLTYQGMRSANQAREADEQRVETRKKNLLILILHYLNEEGYIESAQKLSSETNIDLARYEVADNVDLATVLMEYESYYYIKLGKYPKIAKKLTQSGEPLVALPLYSSRTALIGDERAGRINNHKVSKLKRECRSTSTPSLPRISNGQSSKPATPPVSQPRPRSGKNKKDSPKQTSNGVSPSAKDTEPLALQGLVVHGSHSNGDLPQHGQQQQQQQQHSAQGRRPRAGQIIDIRAMINDATTINVEEGDSSDRLLKPLGGYMGYSSEWRDLAQTISRDIYSQNPNVRWDDIIGLENAKRLVKEAVVYPIRYPQLFTGILSPWKGLLLYGPPGTGKTLLAKAVATECNTTFFNISASSIVSKWRGDSEKLVRVLFEMARFHAPSTIFLDELESLMSQRGSGGGTEHEGSRRMKTELLVQMDGLAKTNDLVFLLAASNLPWELDHAMLRRLEKRIIVDLPTAPARCAMFQNLLPPVVSGGENGLELMSNLDYELLAKKTEGYSGSDIRLVAKEAAMRPVRKIFDALENQCEVDELHIKLEPITTEDAEAALRHTKPSARTLTAKYAAWAKEYESV